MSDTNESAVLTGIKWYLHAAKDFYTRKETWIAMAKVLVVWWFILTVIQYA